MEFSISIKFSSSCLWKTTEFSISAKNVKNFSISPDKWQHTAADLFRLKLNSPKKKSFCFVRTSELCVWQMCAGRPGSTADVVELLLFCAAQQQGLTWTIDVKTKWGAAKFSLVSLPHSSLTKFYYGPSLSFLSRLVAIEVEKSHARSFIAFSSTFAHLDTSRSSSAMLRWHHSISSSRAFCSFFPLSQN